MAKLSGIRIKNPGVGKDAAKRPTLLLDQMREPDRHPWHPGEPPSLAGVDTVYLDFEATGLRWWADDVPIGVAVAFQREGELPQAHYLPWGHSGGNLPKERVIDWMKAELPGKRFVGSKITYDIHMGRKVGVDFEALGCIPGDIGHQAALLDDNRREYGLDVVSKIHLGEGKEENPYIKVMRHVHAGKVASYAMKDVMLPLRLEEVFWPMLEEQELHEVRELEEEVIYATVEMERNGTRLDVEKLDRWIREVEQIKLKLLWEITRDLGFPFNNDFDSLSNMFKKLGIKNPYRTKGGATKEAQESFTDTVLEKFDHPTIKKVRVYRSFKSLDVKFLSNYKKKLDGDILRYGLHQMASEEGGTVSGRYSSSGMSREEGVNIQQVTKPSKQKLTQAKLEKMGMLDLCPWLRGKEYIIRELFLPGDPKMKWGKCDAKQIEYRLFAHFSKAPKILQAYADDPETDFHNLVWEMVKRVKPDFTRDNTKDLNFAKIYGAGIKKIAIMMKFRSPTEPMDSDAGVAEVKPFVETYDEEFPEAKKVLQQASKLAERDGFVRTIMGRRARFPISAFSYKALNRIIQGSAADIQKRKAVELHRERKRLGVTMRFCVHDEFDFDCPPGDAIQEVKKVLDRQSFDLRVPILWDCATGENWKECK